MLLSLTSRFRIHKRVLLVTLGTWIGSLCAFQTAHAQPAVPQAKPSFAVMQEIEDTVATLIEATQSDDGYAAAQKVVSQASSAPSLLRAWREWRMASLTSEDSTAPVTAAPAILKFRLLVQDVEVEEFNPGRGPGGNPMGEATAKIRVRLNIALETPDQPIEQWPSDPWQGEFFLQKAAGEEVSWQFVSPLYDAPQGEKVRDTALDENALIDLPERGGNRIEQAIQVARDPEAMLRTARLLRDTRSLNLLVSAVQHFVALTGHYPSSDYQAALLEQEPPDTQPALRRAFIIDGTTRTWLFNPSLAGYTVPKATARTPLPPVNATPQEAAPQEAVPADAPPQQVPWFWDGAAQGEKRLVAFNDGWIGLRSSKDLPIAPPQ